MSKPLLEYIRENIVDGRLPKDFSLPIADDGSGIPFADGAQDGISIYHMQPVEMDEASVALMADALGASAAGDFEAADEKFAKLGETYRAVSVIDAFQNYIIEHEDALPPREIYKAAFYLLIRSENRESVKYGLSMLEFFEAPGDNAKKAIRDLGLSDEFTIFAVWNMLRWLNGNDEIFDLIKKVRGWGRIHALERLEPVSREIREWMLMEGVDNDVMPAYSALTVWNKANVAGRLKGELTEEEFLAVSRIIYGLFDEGPVRGISAIEDADKHMTDYLKQCGKHEPSPDAYDTVLALHGWAEGIESSELIAMCEEILQSA